MSLERLREHRRIWESKPVLAQIYKVWFDLLLAELADAGRVLEVGAGPGFLSEYVRNASRCPASTSVRGATDGTTAAGSSALRNGRRVSTPTRTATISTPPRIADWGARITDSRTIRRREFNPQSGIRNPQFGQEL